MKKKKICSCLIFFSLKIFSGTVSADWAVLRSESFLLVTCIPFLSSLQLQLSRPIPSCHLVLSHLCPPNRAACIQLEAVNLRSARLAPLESYERDIMEISSYTLQSAPESLDTQLRIATQGLRLQFDLDPNRIVLSLGLALASLALS